MKLTFLRPMLYTDKFDETIEFYATVLGFTVSGRNDDWGWANLWKDKVEIMLAKPNEHTPFEKSIFTGSLYFNTDNVDALWETLSTKATICYEIENFEWRMREFAIYDNNGYILQFGQDISEKATPYG
jgi:uncharacterized glyoxalase superfamily protein PhnB